MSRWYCKEHRHMNPQPNRVTTLYEGKPCEVIGCENKLKLMVRNKK